MGKKGDTLKTFAADVQPGDFIRPQGSSALKYNLESNLKIYKICDNERHIVLAYTEQVCKRLRLFLCRFLCQ